MQYNRTMEPKDPFFSNSKIRGLLVVIILALIVAAFLIEHYDISVLTNTQVIREWIQSFGLWAPMVYIALMTLAIVVVPIPDFVIGLAAGILFPWYVASLYTLIADFLGSSITFFIARRFGRPMVERFVKKEQLHDMDALSLHFGTKTIFLIRLVPGFNFDLVGYLVGLTPLSYQKYIVATMIGILPRRIGTYYLIDHSMHIGPLFILVGILFSMVIVPILFFWMWKKRKTIGEKLH